MIDLDEKPRNKIYQPDRWIVLEIEPRQLYKVLGGWIGGYTYGDQWRMNSGIVRYEKQNEYHLFEGFSGSVYVCGEHNYGTCNITSMELSRLMEYAKNSGHVITPLPEDTNWKELIENMDK